MSTSSTPTSNKPSSTPSRPPQPVSFLSDLRAKFRKSTKAGEDNRTPFERFAAQNLWIRTAAKIAVPFRLRHVQAQLNVQRTARDIICKSRKHGISTFYAALFYWFVTTQKNVEAALVAHRPDATQALWQIVQLLHTRDPRQLATEASSRKELYFADLNSRFTVLDSSQGAGRARTINYLHISELAWWKHDVATTLAGLVAAVPPPELGSIIAIESTSNGEGGEYHRRWLAAVAGRSEYVAHFYPWFEHPEYRAPWRADWPTLSSEEVQLKEEHGLDLEQLAFRRVKIEDAGPDLFAQEYPATWEESFLTSGRPAFGRPGLVALAKLHQKPPIREEKLGGGVLRLWRVPSRGRKYVAGGDTSEGVAGGDAQAIHILDAETLEQVAMLWGRWPLHVFARRAAALVLRYQAFTVLERNNHGHAVLEHWLRGTDEMRLPRSLIYHHSTYDERGKTIKKPGWDTNSKTRPIMVADLEEAIRRGHLIARDADFYKEARMFAYPEDGGSEPSAPDGEHDDLVIAMALALQARKLRGPVGYQSTRLVLH